MRAYIVVCFLLVNSFAMPAAAWWADEHRSIAIIADNHLSDHARKQIEQILGDASLDKFPIGRIPSSLKRDGLILNVGTI